MQKTINVIGNKLNALIQEPYENRVEDIIKDYKEYKYKNETLIDLLEITEYEETQMSTIISKGEYKRRDRVYQKNKYQRKLKSEGKISEKEKISRKSL